MPAMTKEQLKNFRASHKRRMEAQEELCIKMANFLRSKRENIGFDIDSLSYLSGVSHRAIRSIENADTAPSLLSLYRLCKVLEIETLNFKEIFENE